MKPEQYRVSQISQWSFAPKGAFQLFREIGSSRTICEWVFYLREGNELIKSDCSDELKAFLEVHLFAIQP